MFCLKVVLILLILVFLDIHALRIKILNELNRDLVNPHLALPNGGLVYAPQLIGVDESDEVIIDTEPDWEYGSSNYIWGLISWDFYTKGITFAVGWGISSDEDTDSTIIATYYGPSNTSQNLLNQMFNLSNCTPSSYMQLGNASNGYQVNKFYDGTEVAYILQNLDNDPTLELFLEESDIVFEPGNYYLMWNETDTFMKLEPTDATSIAQDYYDPTFDSFYQWNFTKETTGYYTIRNMGGSSGTALYGYVIGTTNNVWLSFFNNQGVPTFSPTIPNYQWDVKLIDGTLIALRSVYASSTPWLTQNLNIPVFASHYACHPFVNPNPVQYQTCTVPGYTMLWQAGAAYDAFSILKFISVDAF